VSDLENLLSLSDALVKKSVWIVGGMAGPMTSATVVWTMSSPPGRNVNVLVFDTEVYSNTGGQMSKGDPARRRCQVRGGREAATQERFGYAGDNLRQRLRRRVAMGASDRQTVQAFLEAEAYDGPSPDHLPTRTASHTATTCVTGWSSKTRRSSPVTGRSSATTLTWGQEGQNPFQLDSKAPSLPLEKYIYREGSLPHAHPEQSGSCGTAAAPGARRRSVRWESYERLAVTRMERTAVAE
jgi:pyruvate-ferredoxin/flavodoxin oxidoreductase